MEEELKRPTLLITAIGIACAGLIYLYWKLFWQPFTLFQDYTELGFEEVDKQQNKKNLINEMRKRRKVGILPPSYPNGWFSIFDSDGLKKGDVKEISAIGQNLVIWRGTVSGVAYVADAYCPHLGAHLGVGGTVRGDCITCPFHGWKFDGEQTGKLTCVPYSEKLPEFAKLKMWKTIETNGCIFIWFHVHDKGPNWYPDTIPEINEGKWSFRGRSVIRVACHIQEIPENGADIAHLNVLHSDSTLCGDNPKGSLFSWDIMRHVWEANWEANPSKDPTRGHEAILKIYHYIKLFNRFSCFHINLDVHQTGPGIVVLYFNTSFGKGVFIQTVTPIAPLLQKVTHSFYTDRWLIHPLAKMILDGESKQVARDVRIWNRKCFLEKPLLTREDQNIKQFRRWFSQFYSLKDSSNTKIGSRPFG